MDNNKINRGVFADGTADTTFKLLFSSENNKQITISLINYLLPHLEVTDITFLDKELPAQNEDDRGAIIDVLCKSNKGDYTLIEMQNYIQTHFLKRARFYASKMTSSIQGKPGKDFDFNIGNTYVIAFLNHSPIKYWADPKLNSDFIVHLITTEEHSHLKMDIFPEYFFIQMHNFGKSEDSLENFFEKLVYSLCNSFTYKETPKYVQGDKLLNKFYETLRLKNMTALEQFLYDLEMDNRGAYKRSLEYEKQLAREEFRAEGIAEGIAEAKLNMARTMLQDGMNSDTVMKYTGLTAEEIAQL